jgi:DNA processing protein
MESLAERTGLTVAELSSMLVLMELEGRVVADNGRYARRS